MKNRTFALIFCRLSMNIVEYVKFIDNFPLFARIKKRKRRNMPMKNVKRVLLEKVAKTAYETAKQEADSACLCFCYQPVMPQKVKEMKKKK
mgnify:FL=1